ncbi:hypothetical protein [Sutcliffiella rhizosphaerae]|uniref:Uncharacterized protein n=1 Tax=Sutcliffiella rhizosphaerae TaxID=2880967 RepID=A0ABM8YL47_9BACI|nr:hypothetical protein [Sutcliffiella rhizosphaerae]CAG9620683.1 hypothetical protein BACCIP111883_01452 [Sutcliffiella rhizosphaerae]
MEKEEQSIFDQPLLAFGLPIIIMLFGAFLLIEAHNSGKLKYIPVVFILLGLSEIIRAFMRRRYQPTKRKRAEINQKSGHVAYILMATSVVCSVLLLIMEKISVEMVLYVQLSMAIVVYPLLKLILLVRQY